MDILLQFNMEQLDGASVPSPIDNVAVVLWWSNVGKLAREADPDYDGQSFSEEMEANRRGYRPFQEDPKFAGDKIIYRS